MVCTHHPLQHTAPRCFVHNVHSATGVQSCQNSMTDASCPVAHPATRRCALDRLIGSARYHLMHNWRALLPLLAGVAIEAKPSPITLKTATPT